MGDGQVEAEQLAEDDVEYRAECVVYLSVDSKGQKEITCWSEVRLKVRWADCNSLDCDLLLADFAEEVLCILRAPRISGDEADMGP